MVPVRALGRTGLTVSALGLGTVKLGRNRGVKYPSAFDVPTDAEAADLLRAAQRMGVTLLDTAPAYGEAEERIGRIIGACGGRDRWTIVTKAGEHFDAASGTSTFDFSERGVRASLEASLRRLRTDRVDCLLLHSDGRDEWVLRESGAAQALLRAKKKGMARCVGISTKTAAGSLLAVRGDAAAGVPAMDVVMLTLNAQEQAELATVREAATAGVGVLVKKALGSGHADAAQRVASLRMCWAEPGVSAVIVGTLSAEHLRESADAAG